MRTISQKPPLSQFLRPLSTLGMGSLPYEEGKDSCASLFRDWDIPFWPQYPRWSPRENFIFQFLSSFPGLEVSQTSASFNESAYCQQEEAYRERLQQVFSFEPPSDWALGYSQMKALLREGVFPQKRVIKLQVTGPGTIWKYFFSNRVSQNRAKQIQRDLSQTLLSVGVAQIRRVRSYERIPLLFIDEPLPVDDVAELSMIVHAFRNSGALVGLHVCSSPAWKRYENLELDIFHFDLTAQPAFSFESRLFIQSFLKKGSWVAWGIVPTAPHLDFRTRDFSPVLLDWVKELSDSELSVERILNQSLITPACGTGTLSSIQDESVFQSVKTSAEGLKALVTLGVGDKVKKISEIP